jgi:hypothetical protein
VNQRERVESPGSQLSINRLWVNRLTPLDLQRNCRFSAAFGNIEPFIGESATHAIQHALANQVPDCSFHNTPRGRCREINLLLGAKQVLQFRVYAPVKLFEVAASVTNHRLGHCGERFGRYLNRPGDKKFDRFGHATVDELELGAQFLQRMILYPKG